MNKNVAALLGLVILTVILTREFLPRTVASPAPAPMIVTQHDTVHDTLRVQVPAPAPKTPNLVIRETEHDAAALELGGKAVPLAPAGPDTTRPQVWPVLSVEVGPKVGDTTTVNTFDLRSGRGATSRVYTAGPLLGVWADSSATPRLTFGPPPAPARVSLGTKLKWGGIGYASCKIGEGIADLLRGH